MSSNNTLKILVTDVNRYIRMLIERELTQEGYDVLCANNGIDAYRRLCEDRSIDLVILDPELFYPYGRTIFTSTLEKHVSTKIILHTYPDMLESTDYHQDITVIEKNAESIYPLKEHVRKISRSRTLP